MCWHWYMNFYLSCSIHKTLRECYALKYRICSISGASGILNLPTWVKGKAIPITGLDRPRGFQEFEAPPDFKTNQHVKVVRLSALRTGRLYPFRNFSWYSFLLEAE
jgi:hypothetical protein